VEVIGAMGDASIRAVLSVLIVNNVCRNVGIPSIRLAWRGGTCKMAGSGTEPVVTTPKHNDSNETGNCESKQRVAE
jgi:hypothetical protein